MRVRCHPVQQSGGFLGDHGDTCKHPSSWGDRLTISHLGWCGTATELRSHTSITYADHNQESQFRFPVAAKDAQERLQSVLAAQAFEQDKERFVVLDDKVDNYIASGP